jgi:origin recognition complex subunit 2
VANSDVPVHIVPTYVTENTNKLMRKIFAKKIHSVSRRSKTGLVYEEEAKHKIIKIETKLISSSSEDESDENLDPNVRQLRKRKVKPALKNVEKTQQKENTNSLESVTGKQIYGIKPPSAKRSVTPDESESSSSDSDINIDDEDEELTKHYSSYFSALADSKVKTSNNTLSDMPNVDPPKLRKIIKTRTNNHKAECDILNDFYVGMYSQWLFELMNGYNLLFYGYGSKKDFIDKFVQEELNDYPVLIVNGYVPTITIKEILLNIINGILKLNITATNIVELCDVIVQYFTVVKTKKVRKENKVERFYLVVHNIDGPNLRSEKTQNIFSMLANCQNIMLISSIDHINSASMWDASKQFKFNFVYHDVSTFVPYTIETSYEDNLLMKSTDLSITGIKHVLMSLTENAVAIFRILLEYQLKNEDSIDAGLSYPVYFNTCRTQFLVNNDTTFRTQLTEFKDHKMIIVKKLKDGDILCIPLTKEKLLQVKEMMDNKFE